MKIKIRKKEYNIPAEQLKMFLEQREVIIKYAKVTKGKISLNKKNKDYKQCLGLFKMFTLQNSLPEKTTAIWVVCNIPNLLNEFFEMQRQHHSDDETFKILEQYYSKKVIKNFKFFYKNMEKIFKKLEELK